MKNARLSFALALLPFQLKAAAPLTITTVAGNGSTTFSGDGGPATSAGLNVPVAIAVDAAGNIYIGGQFNNRVRKVTPQGVISTIAGNGSQGFSGHGGPATSASFNSPTGLFADGLGNLFIADVGDGRIRKIDAGGIITPVAGNGGRSDSGDGGPAISAALNNPTAVALDTANNLYISDQFNHRIRKVDGAENITTIAGTGSAGFSGDGSAATSANLNYPGGLIVDTSGNIYFADDLNFRVRQIPPAGIITTVAGNGTQGCAGDAGPAVAANLNGQFGVALDPAGDLLIADSTNNRIRLVSSLFSVTPTFPATAVTHGRSFVSGATAGALGTIFGLHLSTNLLGIARSNGAPLPTGPGGATVTINGVPAPLFAAAPIAGQSTASIVVSTGLSSNAPVTVPLSTAPLGLLSLDGVHGAIDHADGSIVTSAKLAAAGETVVVFATGLGPVTPPVASGQAASSTVLSNTTTPANATIAGGSQDLVVFLSGATSKSMKIAVK